jgi:hypothetical protein
MKLPSARRQVSKAYQMQINYLLNQIKVLKTFFSALRAYVMLVTMASNQTTHLMDEKKKKTTFSQ